MGGDKYVAAVAGDEVEDELGNELRGRWEEIFDELIPEIEPLPGARALLVALKERGLTGGFAWAELDDAGAAAVFEGAEELARRLEAVLAAA